MQKRFMGLGKALRELCPKSCNEKDRTFINNIFNKYDYRDYINEDLIRTSDKNELEILISNETENIFKNLFTLKAIYRHDNQAIIKIICSENKKSLGKLVDSFDDSIKVLDFEQQVLSFLLSNKNIIKERIFDEKIFDISSKLLIPDLKHHELGSNVDISIILNVLGSALDDYKDNESSNDVAYALFLVDKGNEQDTIDYIKKRMENSTYNFELSKLYAGLYLERYEKYKQLLQSTNSLFAISNKEGAAFRKESLHTYLKSFNTINEYESIQDDYSQKNSYIGDGPTEIREKILYLALEELNDLSTDSAYLDEYRTLLLYLSVEQEKEIAESIWGLSMGKDYFFKPEITLLEAIDVINARFNEDSYLEPWSGALTASASDCIIYLTLGLQKRLKVLGINYIESAVTKSFRFSTHDAMNLLVKWNFFEQVDGAHFKQIVESKEGNE